MLLPPSGGVRGQKLRVLLHAPHHERGDHAAIRRGRQPQRRSAVAALVALLALATALPAAPATSGYVGSKICSGCHRKLYDDFVKTAMGRSMSLAKGPLPRSPVTIHDQKLDRHFEVFEKDGAIYQTERQRSGQLTVFQSTHRLEYAVGSGVNGITYIVRRGNHLFQAPLSFYSRIGRWALSPGYESSDYGFSRPIYSACINCHSGQPQPLPERDGQYRDPPFREVAIGCENCHGPGEAHAYQRSKILNPARLPARLAEDICMNCHQGGDARVVQPGKQLSDFRPGTALNDVVAIFKLSSQAQAGDKDLLEHHEAMRLSRCYQGSGGKLNCLSCHNPHRMPKSADAPAYYRSQCLACHSANDCKLLPQRLQIKPSDDCAGCHMPKRAIREIAHSALTNHRIIIRTGAPLPTTAIERPDPALPGLILFNRGVQPLPLLTRLAAYGELLGREPALLPNYLATLDLAGKELPDHPVVLAGLGRRALRGSDERALDYLSRALEKGSTAPTTFLDLADAFSRAGRLDDAIKVLTQGIALEPFSKDLQKSLILRLVNASQYGPR